MATPALPEGYTLIDETVPKGFEVVEEPSFVDRVTEQVTDTIDRAKEGRELYMEDEISVTDYAASLAATPVSAFFNSLGEGVVTVLSTITDDRIEDFIKEQIASGGTALMSSETGQELLNFYNSLPEGERYNLGTFLEMGVSMVPGGKLGKKAILSAIKADKRELSSKVLDQSEKSKKQRLRENAKGYPNNRKFQTTFEEDVLNSVLGVKGVRASDSPKKLLDKVTTETTRLDNELALKLADSEVVIPRGVVAKRRAQVLNEFFQQNPEYATKQFKSVREKVFQAYNIGMKDFDGSPASLLQARQRMDKALRNMLKESELFQSEGAVKDIVKVYRQSLNDIVAESVDNVDVKHSLNRQFHLLTATDNLIDATSKKKSVGAAAAQQVKQHPILTVGAVSGSGMGSNLLQQEALGVGLLGLGTAYGLSRPGVRRAAGEVLDNVPLGRGAAFGAMDSTQEIMNEEEKQ